MECIVCGQEFVRASNNQKCCNKDCSKINRKKWYQEHKEEEKEYSKDYYLRPKVRGKRIEYCKEYYQKNKEHLREQSKKYREENKERRNIRDRERMKDPIFKLNHRMSNAIRKSLKFNGTSKAGRHWETLVGYTKQQLKDHLESLFTEGMSWDKILNGEIHIDHIIPKSFFEYKSTDDVEFKYCWSLDNLQPLWAEENIEKGDSLIVSDQDH